VRPAPGSRWLATFGDAEVPGGSPELFRLLAPRTSATSLLDSHHTRAASGGLTDRQPRAVIAYAFVTSTLPPSGRSRWLSGATTGMRAWMKRKEIINRLDLPLRHRQTPTPPHAHCRRRQRSALQVNNRHRPARADSRLSWTARRSVRDITVRLSPFRQAVSPRHSLRQSGRA